MTEMRYFKLSDFNCQETGNNEMCEKFLTRLDDLRHKTGFPFVITSGYRDPAHSIEAAKSKPGKHAQGIAADIKYNSSFQAYMIVKNALEMGFNGVGIAKTFIHVDTRKDVPKMWCY